MKHLTYLFALCFSFFVNIQSNAQSNKTIQLNYIKTNYLTEEEKKNEANRNFLEDKRYFEVLIKDNVYTWTKLPKSKSIIIEMYEKIYMKINLNDSSYLCQMDNSGKKHLIKDKYQPKEWTITDRTKAIGGWNCILAIKKNKPQETAWFTPDIPLNYGPLGVLGLPGLVVLLTENSNIYALEEIKEVDKELAPEPISNKSITIAEFEDMWRKETESFFQNLRDNTDSIEEKEIEQDGKKVKVVTYKKSFQ